MMNAFPEVYQKLPKEPRRGLQQIKKHSQNNTFDGQDCLALGSVSNVETTTDYFRDQS